MQTVTKKRIAVGILISNKIDSKTKIVNREKKGYFIAKEWVNSKNIHND